MKELELLNIVVAGCAYVYRTDWNEFIICCDDELLKAALYLSNERQVPAALACPFGVLHNVARIVADHRHTEGIQPRPHRPACLALFRNRSSHLIYDLQDAVLHADVVSLVILAFHGVYRSLRITISGKYLAAEL